MRLAFIMVSSFVVGACSIVYSSDLNDANATTSSSPATSGDDASASDASTTDSSGLKSDTGLDGSPVVTRGCAGLSPPPKFCMDFDQQGVTDVTTGWDAIHQENGVVTFDDQIFYSPPRSLKVKMTNADGCEYTRVEKTWKGVGKNSLSVKLKFRPTAPWAYAHAPLVVSMNDPSGQFGYCAMLFYVNDGPDHTTVLGTQVNAQYGDPQKNDVRDLVGKPRVNEWTEVGIRATNAAPNAKGSDVTFSYDYEDGDHEEKVVHLGQCPLGGDADIGVGFHCGNNSGEVHYDDIRVDWE